MRTYSKFNALAFVTATALSTLAGCSAPRGDLPETAGAAATEAAPAGLSMEAWNAFADKAFPSLRASCGKCHGGILPDAGSPVPGRVRFLSATARESYAQLDAMALVFEGGGLEWNLDHAKPTVQQEDVDAWAIGVKSVRAWLKLEARDRAGTVADPAVYARLVTCVTPEMMEQSGVTRLRTTRRPREDRNACTGCDRSTCSPCHTGRPSGFDMAYAGAGGNPGAAPSSDPNTFLRWFVGVRGTSLVPSGRLGAHAESWKEQPAYSHPQLVLTAEQRSALGAVAAGAQRRYDAGECGR